MTDEFDLELRERLGSLAAAVPVAPAARGGIDRVRTPVIRAGSMGRRSSLVEPVPALAVVVVGVLLAGLVALGVGGRSDGTEPVAATPPVVETIGLLTVAGPHDNGCLSARASGRLARDPVSGLGLSFNGDVRPIRWPFGFTAEAGPSGAVLYDDNGEVYAREGDELAFGGGEGPDQIFAVCSPFPATTEPSPATETADPLQPIIDIAIDGSYSLELRAPRRTFVENAPIDIGATFRYSGDTPITITHGANGWIGFGIREPVHGLQLGPAWLTSCGPTDLDPGFEKTHPFGKSGGVSANDPDHDLKLAFLQDPVLRLPPGIWHIVAIAAFAEAPACGGHRPALDTEIEIEVVPAPVITNPPPTFPNASAGPILPDGSVASSVTSGEFVLTLRADSGVYQANEPMTVWGEIRYLGSNSSIDVGTAGSFGVFGLEQLDGERAVWGGAPDICVPGTIEREEPMVVPYNKNQGADRNDPEPEWREAYFADPLLRVPAGTWRIWMYSEIYPSPCDGPGSREELRTTIVVKVVP